MNIENVGVHQQKYTVDNGKNNAVTKPDLKASKQVVEQQDINKDTTEVSRTAFFQSQVRPFENKVAVNSNVSDIWEKGTELQKSAVYYFDSDGDGIISANEAFNFNNSKIEKNDDYIKITAPNGEITTFEDILKDKGDEYYKKGTIPIAVVDMFTGKDAGCGGHGISVCNMLKNHNPDLSITKVNASQLKDYSPEQIAILDYTMEEQNNELFYKICTSNDNNYDELAKYPDFVKFIEQYPDIQKELNTTNDVKKLFEKNRKTDEFEEYLNSFKEIKKAMEDGSEFKAVNLSSTCGISYKSINELCEGEIGEKITPENISKYKNQIKLILYKNKDKNIPTGRADDGDNAKISKITDIIDAIEDIKIPVYMAGAYRKDNGTTEAFNIYALADNAINVEAEAKKDGETITHPLCSPSSLSVNSQTGKKYIADSRANANGVIIGASTSLAAPIVLAESLKK